MPRFGDLPAGPWVPPLPVRGGGRASSPLLPALVVAALLAGCIPGPRAPGQIPAADLPTVGPPQGTVLVAGGGFLGPEIMQRFVALAGGAEARIVVIPTAGGEEEFGSDWGGHALLREAGAREVTVLHTRDPQEANSQEFVEPLREATGVWFPGGRQWRLVDSYLGTRTQRELAAVLQRGGVVGGTSAGASILASYLVRGAQETNTVVMAPGYEEGFGFLQNTAVDQHLLARGRERDLLQVLAVHPHLLGIGVDEGTALIVQGDRGEVVGRSHVLIYPDPQSAEDPYFILDPGAVVNLRTRTRLPPSGLGELLEGLDR